MRRWATAIAEQIRHPDPRLVGWAAACMYVNAVPSSKRSDEAALSTARLLSHLPNGKELGIMIDRRRTDWQQFPLEIRSAPIVRGAAVLRVVEALDKMIQDGMSAVSACLRLKSAAPGTYDKAVVDAANDLGIDRLPRPRESTMLARLPAGSVLDENIHGRDGQILVQKGVTVTADLLHRLHALNREVGVVEPLWIIPPV